MDLIAYTQIEDLKGLLSDLQIEIPRLRGLRLMEDEERVSDQEIYSLISHLQTLSVWELIESRWSGSSVDVVSEHTERKYLKYDQDGSIAGIRWENLHGRKRNVAKYYVKRTKRMVIKQCKTFNKYVGRSDVLYAHARIGSDLWDFQYGKQIERHPAFLEKVDDCFDPTYCDIYLQTSEELKGDKT